MRHTEHGDRNVAMGGEILRTVVGSGVHGIAIEGTDDHDEMGVFVEPASHPPSSNPTSKPPSATPPPATTGPCT